MSTSSQRKPPHEQTGKLRIGDDWNAINIIALSQSNPLKSVAEFVENSIDAQAKHITIIRGRSRGQSYLKIADDGEGVPLDGDGKPNFKYVATHICDSIKREMKARGQQGIQGEFGIGLLSFWTVGETLTLVSAGSDGKVYEMRMAKGAPSYAVSPVRRLLPSSGTELTIHPLLPGIRHFSGEKLQWYLASELRDRIRQSGDEVICQQQHAAEEKSNRDTLRAIQRAFREALLVLPEEEYDWFEGYGVNEHRRKRPGGPPGGTPLDEESPSEPQVTGAAAEAGNGQRQFFEYAGPLFSVRISPATCTMPVNTTRQFRAMARDRGGRQIEQNVTYEWSIVEGAAQLSNESGEIATLTITDEPQLVRLRVIARQGQIELTAESLITVTDSILPDRPRADVRNGLPDYTFEKRPGELWRSRYNAEQNVIVMNNAHRDFVYAARNKSLKLRYICRLFAKELVIRNFPGYSADELLERIIELLQYTEENLR